MHKTLLQGKLDGKAREGSRESTYMTETRRKGKGKSNPIDAHVGKRLRLRRTLLGLSQEKLGESVELTFQQIQKYERGANRIGASRLFAISRVLDVPVGYFFEDMDEDAAKFAKNSDSYEGLNDNSTSEDDKMAKRETLELVRAYYRIKDPAVRKRLFELTKSIANQKDLEQ